jgi:hypothetical protein
MVALGTGYRTVIGGLLYRAGPDPVRDTMGFADGHGGNFLPDGRFYGHTWLQVGANIVDFSCGDWKGIATAAGEAGTDNLDHIENLAPIVWESTPPQFFWKYRARLEPTREICAAEAKRNGGYLSPPVGHAWYLGFDQSKYSEAVSMLERFRANAHANPVMERAVKHVMRQIVKHFGRPQPHPRGLSSLSNDFGGKE